MSPSPAPVALVTGASSGIGAATVVALAEAGFQVYAGARRPDAIPPRPGVHPLALDVTDELSIEQACATIERAHGAVDLLVNNAGIGPLGPLEDLPRAGWQTLFETNVFGMASLCRRLLPGMRARGRGRIVNVGSAGGEFTTPLGGAYHASKYAVEALSDALRAEVLPFGVSVVLVQPGPVKTPMARAAAEITVPAGSSYGPAVEAFTALARNGYASGRGYVSPEAVARAIVRAALARRPSARYKVGLLARMLPRLRRLLPLRWWDALQARTTGLDRLARLPRPAADPPHEPALESQ